MTHVPYHSASVVRFSRRSAVSNSVISVMVLQFQLKLLISSFFQLQLSYSYCFSVSVSYVIFQLFSVLVTVI